MFNVKYFEIMRSYDDQQVNLFPRDDSNFMSNINACLKIFICNYAHLQNSFQLRFVHSSVIYFIKIRVKEKTSQMKKKINVL